MGYVYADELELYISAYKKELAYLSVRQQRILDLLLHEGPLTCGHIKEETGWLAKEIMPELHKLQEAFLVYEDQTDGDWDRGWYVFEREWESVNINRYTRHEAIAIILMKFLHLAVFATEDSMKSWVRLSAKDIRAALATLEASKQIVAADTEGTSGWVTAEDLRLLQSDTVPSANPSVFVLHRADFLVKSQEHLLKQRFAGLEVLQYILIDGLFQGAVLGHWRQGPHDVDDVVLRLCRRQSVRRENRRFWTLYWLFIIRRSALSENMTERKLKPITAH